MRFSAKTPVKDLMLEAYKLARFYEEGRLAGETRVKVKLKEPTPENKEKLRKLLKALRILMGDEKTFNDLLSAAVFFQDLQDHPDIFFVYEERAREKLAEVRKRRRSPRRPTASPTNSS